MHYFCQDVTVIGNIFQVNGKYSTTTIDDSFTHEFGTKISSHEEVTDVIIEEVFLYDKEGDVWEIEPREPLKREFIERLKQLLTE